MYTSRSQLRTKSLCVRIRPREGWARFTRIYTGLSSGVKLPRRSHLPSHISAWRHRIVASMDFRPSMYLCVRDVILCRIVYNTMPHTHIHIMQSVAHLATPFPLILRVTHSDRRRYSYTATSMGTHLMPPQSRSTERIVRLIHLCHRESRGL